MLHAPKSVGGGCAIIRADDMCVLASTAGHELTAFARRGRVLLRFWGCQFDVHAVAELQEALQLTEPAVRLKLFNQSRRFRRIGLVDLDALKELWL